jgi:hypothetical protein
VGRPPPARGFPRAAAYLRQQGVEQVGYQDAIEVRSPNPEETVFFDLPADGRIQVIEIFRVAFDQKHVPMRLTLVSGGGSNRQVGGLIIGNRRLELGYQSAARRRWATPTEGMSGSRRPGVHDQLLGPLVIKDCYGLPGG